MADTAASFPIKLAHSASFVTIQYLRGLAAVIVVYFHTKIYMPNFGWNVDRSFGYAGVDIFFAISGFIMIVTTSQREHTPLRFIKKRILRIYPIYWIATCVAFLIFALMPSAFVKDGLDPTYIVASLLLIPIENQAGTSHGVPFLKIAWTLVFEVFFYAMFALALFLSDLKTRLTVLSAVMLGLVAYGFIGKPDSAMMKFYTNPLIIEFLFGCFVGFLILRNSVVLSKSSIALLALAAIVMIGSGSGQGDGYMRLIWFGVPSAVLVFCCAALDKGDYVTRQIPVLRLLGDASYSIYLFQSFLLVGARLVTAKLNLPMETLAFGVPGIIGAVVIAILGGVSIHILIERPCLLMARTIDRTSFTNFLPERWRRSRDEGAVP